MIVPALQFTPDGPHFGPPDGRIVTGVNMIPSDDGLVAAQEETTLTPSLGVVRGAGFGRSPQGNAVNFAGTTTDLYSVTSATANNISSTSGAYAVGGSDTDFWEFAQFGSFMLGTRGDAVDAATSGFPIQQYDIDAGGVFGDITGAPAAKTIAVVRDFVMAGNTWDATDGLRANRVRWCAINDHTSWTVSATTQADFNDFPDATIQKIVGGEFGTIIADEGVWRAQYVGSPLVFQFDRLVGVQGTGHPATVVEAGNSAIYYWSAGGFYALGGDGATRRIGVGRVDATFNATVTGEAWGVPIYGTPMAIWFPSRAVDIGYLYDWSRDRWGVVQFDDVGIVIGMQAGAASNLDNGELITVLYKATDSSNNGGVPCTWTAARKAVQSYKSMQAATAAIKLDDGIVTLDRAQCLASSVSQLGVSGSISGSIRARYAANDASNRNASYATVTLNSGSLTFTTRATGRYFDFNATLPAEGVIFKGWDLLSVKKRGGR